MPSQQSHQVPSQESQISDFPWISPHPAKMQNEPNKETQAAGLPPLYLTPTEVGDTPTAKKMRNEPNLPPWPSCPTPKYAKRTQSQPSSQPTPLAEGQSRFIGKPNFQPPIYYPQSTIYNIQSPGPIPKKPPFTIHQLRRKEGSNIQRVGEGGLAG